MNNKILIIGANGMLGSTLLRYFCAKKKFSVGATVRNTKSLKNLITVYNYELFNGINVNSRSCLSRVFKEFNPNIVINCVGLVKQLTDTHHPLEAIMLNSFLPHYLVKLSLKYKARFIHFSTDCVFSGKKGNYAESDLPDPLDLYGRSKLLGEINYSNAITLRTSIIGHEIESCRSLLNWFLSQSKNIQGYKKVIFSGLPTYEIARIIHDYILPNRFLNGLYHVSGDPINKYDLLLLVKNTYGKNINIIPNNKIMINRSLDSSRFRKATGFSPKSWNLLIREMKAFG
jgi:dTDP-4-dehydrorhamnose reductase